MSENENIGSEKKKIKPVVLRIILLIALLLLIIFLSLFFLLYKTIYRNNVNLGGRDSVFVYIPSHSDFESVCDTFYSHQYIKDKKSFEWLANKMKYPSKVKPGKYMLRKNMGNKALISMLRSGKQTPVKLTFNSIRTKKELAIRISSQLEADSSELFLLLHDERILSQYDLSSKNCLVMFIPNTYEFYWNTSAEQFLSKMHKEYKKFWSEKRKAKLAGTGLNKTDVSILASIVQAEQTRFNDEKPRIAGLYINRLKKGMLLQSDPTVIYAIGIFNIRRVLNRDKNFDSPYNTYLYAGLPPGPICIPEISSIDAVLNYETNDYLYMCAKEDLSGYHNFSRTQEQHMIYARKYQQALNKMNIKR